MKPNGNTVFSGMRLVSKSSISPDHASEQLADLESQLESLLSQINETEPDALPTKVREKLSPPTPPTFIAGKPGPDAKSKPTPTPTPTPKPVAEPVVEPEAEPLDAVTQTDDLAAQVDDLLAQVQQQLQPAAAEPTADAGATDVQSDDQPTRDQPATSCLQDMVDAAFANGIADEATTESPTPSSPQREPEPEPEPSISEPPVPRHAPGSPGTASAEEEADIERMMLEQLGLTMDDVSDDGDPPPSEVADGATATFDADDDSGIDQALAAAASLNDETITAADDVDPAGGAALAGATAAPEPDALTGSDIDDLGKQLDALLQGSPRPQPAVDPATTVPDEPEPASASPTVSQAAEDDAAPGDDEQALDFKPNVKSRTTPSTPQAESTETASARLGPAPDLDFPPGDTFALNEAAADPIDDAGDLDDDDQTTHAAAVAVGDDTDERRKFPRVTFRGQQDQPDSAHAATPGKTSRPRVLPLLLNQLRLLCATISQPFDLMPPSARTAAGVVGVVSVVNGIGLVVYALWLR